MAARSGSFEAASLDLVKGLCKRGRSGEQEGVGWGFGSPNCWESRRGAGCLWVAGAAVIKAGRLAPLCDKEEAGNGAHCDGAVQEHRCAGAWITITASAQVRQAGRKAVS